MYKRCVLLVAAALVAISMSGCSRIAYIAPEQAHLYHHQTIQSIEIPIAIVGAKLKSGVIITFAPPTALYSGTEQALVGEDSDGNHLSIPLDSATSVLLCRIDRSLNESYSVPAMSFLQESVGRRSPVCDGRVYPMKELVRLDSGGTFDTLLQSISGKTKEGQSISVSVHTVARVAVQKLAMRMNDKGPACEQFVAPPKRNWTSRLVFLSTSQAKLVHLQTLEAVEIPVAIEKIEETSGRVATFGSPGALFDNKRRVFNAVDSNGDSVHIGIDSVAFVAIRRIDRPMTEIDLIKKAAYLSQYSRKSPLSFSDARYPFAERVKFDRSFGVYDTIYQEVSGRARDSSIVCARFDNISAFGVRRFDLGTTLGKIMLYGGITVAIAALVTNQLMEQMDLNMDWSGAQ